MQKTNQKESRIEKVLKRKGDKLYVKWKGCDNSDFDAKLSSLSRKITANKTKHFRNDNDLSYYRCKRYFDGSGKQNYLVFLPINKYFRLNSVANVADYVLSWQSKGLSNETIRQPTTSDNSLAPELNYYGTKTKIKFTRNCLK